jgi:hypothetical protein
MYLTNQIKQMVLLMDDGPSQTMKAIWKDERIKNMEWIAVWSLERVASDTSTNNTQFIERGNLLTTQINS